MRLTHTQTLSGKGPGPEKFLVRLVGIAVDSGDRLLALGDREIKRFSSEGQLEQRFPTRDAGWSIVAKDEAIWVGMQGGIDRYDFEGTLVTRIEDPHHLGLITGLAVEGETLFAADATNHTIHLYRNGKWQHEVGQEVNTRGFMIPNGILDISLDTERKSFLVAHPQKHRVERYSLDGELINKFGHFGMNDPADFGGCCNPTNITATADGLIAVSEKAPPCVKIFDSDGKFLAQSGAGVFDGNTKNIDLAADSHGHLFATDPQKCTIEEFQLELASD